MVFDFGIDMIPSAALLVADFEAIADDLSDFSDPLRRVVEDVVAPSIRKNFDVGGRPPWTSLAAGTTDQKDGDSILVSSGALRDTMSSPDVWEIDSETAAINGFPEEVYYGQFHNQDGGTAFMPSRPFLMVQPEDVDQMEDKFSTWIGEKFDDHGFS